MNENERLKIKDEIIEATLPHVAFDGWDWEAVKRGAEDAGHEMDIVRKVFPQEMRDILAHFSDRADRAMLAALESINPEDLRVRDRVRDALMARFEWLAPHKEAVRISLNFWAVPTRKPAGAKIVWRTADKIWDWAGDTSTDYNRYTKRGLLSGVIVPTTLVWLKDDDEDLATTRDFLEHRLDEVVKVGGTIGKVIRKFQK